MKMTEDHEQEIQENNAFAKQQRRRRRKIVDANGYEYDYVPEVHADGGCIGDDPEDEQEGEG